MGVVKSQANQGLWTFSRSPLTPRHVALPRPGTGLSPGAYKALRLVVALYFSAWIFLSGLGVVPQTFLPSPIGWGPNEVGKKWLIFLTNWSMILLGVYLWLACLGAFNLLTSQTSRNLLWLLRNISAPSAGIVTLVYWLMLFPTAPQTNLVDFHCHAVNSIIILGDMVISRVPYYLQHWYQPATYLSQYLLFTFLYWRLGGTGPWGDHYIYEPMDFSGHPVRAALLVLALALVVLPMLHVMIWGWCRLWEKVLGGSGQEEEGEEEQGVEIDHQL